MSDLMDRILSRYSERLTRIVVPEWGDDDGPMVLYAKPYTIQDDKHMTQFLRDDNPEGFVEVLVRKALDAEGHPVFSVEDKPRLRRAADASVIKRVAMEIMASITTEDAEKN